MTWADLQLLAAAVLLFVPLERMLPLHEGQKPFRPGLAVDVFHLFISGFVIRTGATAVAVILSFSAASAIPEAVHSLVRGQPVWAQFVELLLLSDLCFYVAHRIVHAVPWMWRFHMVHHSSEQLDWLATYRVHPLDQIFNSTIIALPAIALGFSPLPLLIYAFLYRWHSMLLHSNIKVELGPLGWLLTTPRFHHWHHANEPRAFNKNFGGQLAIWDRLFRTAHDEMSAPSSYGSGGVPRTYLGQLWAPFTGTTMKGVRERSDAAAADSNHALAIAGDAALHGFIAAYFMACAATAVLLGMVQKFQPLMYSAKWLELLIYGVSAAFAWAGIASLRASQPLGSFRDRLKTIFSPHACAGLVMILALSVFAGLFTSFKTMLADLAPFTADPTLAKLDAAIHGGDPWRTVPLVPTITYLIEKLYFPGWTFLLLASVASATLMPRFRQIRSQYLWTYLITWTLLGNVVAGLVMSAGPIFYEQITGSHRFAELTGYVATQAPMTSQISDWLWSNYKAGLAGSAAGISAFPSLHLALATLFVIQAWHVHWRLGLALSAFCAAILVGSVHLGWHYAVDGYFSIIATLAIWKATGWILAGNLRLASAKTSSPSPAYP